jgi:uncharacterized membrane protein
MQFSKLALAAIVGAIAAYFVHGYLDKNLDKHPDLN